MNLIINRQLDRAQKQVIQELTLKKRQSKKSTMSAKQVAARQQLARELMHEEALKDRKIEVNIKFLNTRLEHLNGELERRLYQYEYLVAQEKALLGTKNLMLFTQQGVNNFHLYEAHSTPARRVRSFQQQQQQLLLQNSRAKSKIQQDSSSSLSRSSTDSDTAANSRAALVNQRAARPQPAARGHLNSSASTVANLNTLHMLPSLAGPRRSASSVALLSVSQSRTIE